MEFDYDRVKARGHGQGSAAKAITSSEAWGDFWTLRARVGE